MATATKNDILFSLRCGSEVGFKFQGHEYWISDRADQKTGYVIVQTPDILLYQSDKDNWQEAMNDDVIQGKSINDLFNQIEFTDYMTEDESLFS